LIVSVGRTENFRIAPSSVIGRAYSRADGC